jgi:hypothetical protein
VFWCYSNSRANKPKPRKFLKSLQNKDFKNFLGLGLSTKQLFSKKAKTKGGTKRRLLFLLFELP